MLFCWDAAERLVAPGRRTLHQSMDWLPCRFMEVVRGSRLLPWRATTEGLRSRDRGECARIHMHTQAAEGRSPAEEPQLPQSACDRAVKQALKSVHARGEIRTVAVGVPTIVEAST